MTEIEKHEPGMFCWVELAAKDGPAAKKFYTSLFGWRANDIPIGEGAVYSMLEKGDKEAGAFCWNELYTTDPKKAGDFYSELFGWTREPLQMPTGEYTIFKRGDSQAAGMMRIPKEMGPTPPHWLVYFAVDDSDRTVDKARGMGAKVGVPPTDVPNIGRFAIL